MIRGMNADRDRIVIDRDVRFTAERPSYAEGRTTESGKNVHDKRVIMG